MSCIASALAMQLGEFGRRYAAQATVRPDLVMVLAPDANGGSGLVQRLEPMLVQALVPELAVEALDVAVLHRPPGLDEDVPNAVGLCPGHEYCAGELRAVVGPHPQRVYDCRRFPNATTIGQPLAVAGESIYEGLGLDRANISQSL